MAEVWAQKSDRVAARDTEKYLRSNSHQVNNYDTLTDSARMSFRKGLATALGIPQHDLALLEVTILDPSMLEGRASNWFVLTGYRQDSSLSAVVTLKITDFEKWRFSTVIERDPKRVCPETTEDGDCTPHYLDQQKYRPKALALAKDFAPIAILLEQGTDRKHESINNFRIALASGFQLPENLALKVKVADRNPSDTAPNEKFRTTVVSLVNDVTGRIYLNYGLRQLRDGNLVEFNLYPEGEHAYWQEKKLLFPSK